MLREKRTVAYLNRLIEIDSALARGGLELQTFAYHLGIPSETLREDLGHLKRLGFSIRSEVFRGQREFFCYARDQVPLFSKNVSMRLRSESLLPSE